MAASTPAEAFAGTLTDLYRPKKKQVQDERTPCYSLVTGRMGGDGRFWRARNE